MKAGLPEVIEQLQEAGGGLTDGQLLARFVAARDEASFAALVRRHGPMVLGVCRRVLRDFHDAEDAFQAVFLILARRAPSVVRRESVGCYLYAVAYRAALEAAGANARRRAREKLVREMPHPVAAPTDAPDWKPLLDRELDRLSESYRGAVVLCDLEGRTRKEAGRILGVSENTVSSRLARARALLAKRLAARGVLLPAGALALLVAADAASAQVPAALVSSMARVAALVAAGQMTAAAGPAVALMKGVMQAMLVKKLRLAVGAFMLAALLGAVGLACRPVGQAQAQDRVKTAADPTTPTAGKAPADADALRREVEDLRATVRVLLKENRALEKELDELRGRPAPGGGRGVLGRPTPDAKLPPQHTDLPGKGGGGRFADPFDPLARPRDDKSGVDRPRGASDSSGAPPAGDLYPDDKGGVINRALNPKESHREALAAAAQKVEAALKALREARDPESEQRATRHLERAIRDLQQEFAPADATQPKRS